MSKAWDYDDDDDDDDECDDIIPTAVQAARSCPKVRHAGRREVNQGTWGWKGVKKCWNRRKSSRNSAV